MSASDLTLIERKSRVMEFEALKEGKLAHSYEVRLVEATVSDEKYALFCEYYTAVHKKEPSDRENWDVWLGNSPLYDDRDPEQRFREPRRSTQDLDSIKKKLKTGPYPEWDGSYHMEHWIDGELVAVGLLDLMPGMLVSSQFFYKPSYRALSMGRVGVLREIEWARKLNKFGDRKIEYYGL